MLVRVALVETQYYYGVSLFFVGKIQAATKSHLISLSLYTNGRMISFR